MVKGQGGVGDGFYEGYSYSTRSFLHRSHGPHCGQELFSPGAQLEATCQLSSGT